MTKNAITAKRKGISQLIVGPNVVEKKVKDQKGGREMERKTGQTKQKKLIQVLMMPVTWPEIHGKSVNMIGY